MKIGEQEGHLPLIKPNKDGTTAKGCESHWAERKEEEKGYC